MPTRRCTTTPGAAIGAVPLEPYLGRCRVIHAIGAARWSTGRTSRMRCAACRRACWCAPTSASPTAGTPTSAAFAPETIERLADLGVQLIGIDTASIDPADSKTLDSHQVIRRRGLRVLENLVLDDVPEGDYELIALPLKLTTADASPVRAVLREWRRQMKTRERRPALDAADPLAPLRAQFSFPTGLIYLDGNSLGVMPRATAARVQQVVTQEWGAGLIRSWNTAGWIELPPRIGDKIARLVGAGPGEWWPPTRPRSTCSRCCPRRWASCAAANRSSRAPTRRAHAHRSRAQQLPDRPLHRRGPARRARPRAGAGRRPEAIPARSTHVRGADAHARQLPHRPHARHGRADRAPRTTPARWRCGTWRTAPARCRWTCTARKPTSPSAAATST